MKSKLVSEFSAYKLDHRTTNKDIFYVVDYTEKTKSVKGVDVLEPKPTDIDPLIVHNPKEISITTSIFKSQCFMGADGLELKQCECVMYPTTSTVLTWVLFVEIKDCKPANASVYHKEIKEKFVVNIGFFREKGIIPPKKVVYAVASFPRKGKTNFHNHLIKATEWKKFRDDHKIMIKGTNEITVKNDISIL